MTIVADGHGNGGTVSDDDVRAMLAQEKANSQRLKRELETERTGRNRAEQTASTHATARFEAEELTVAARVESADTQASGSRKTWPKLMRKAAMRTSRSCRTSSLNCVRCSNKTANTRNGLRGRKPAPDRRKSRAVPGRGGSVAILGPAAEMDQGQPEFMDDARVWAKTFAGHQLAMAEGIEVDNPEYFQVIDEVVHRGKRSVREDDAEDDGPRRRDPRPAEIPVSRSALRQTERQRAVKLSADEMEAADITNPEIPIHGHKDAAGNWVPARYE